MLDPLNGTTLSQTNTQINTQTNAHQCWQTIGVWGDRSCSELPTFVHCRNCSVFSVAGQRLLDRDPPSGYLQEWTDLYGQHKDLSEVRQNTPAGTLSLTIFRLGNEWLALSASLFQEITQPTVIRTLPHRSSAVLLGVINIRGEVQLCISLKAFLGLDDKNAQSGKPGVTYQRMIVVEKEGDRWVFPVDELYGTQRFHPDELLNVPSTVSKVQDAYSKALLDWQGYKVIYLDDELLFYALNRKVL